MKLEGRALSQEFSRGTPVLNGVDVTLTPGECVALIGANGAGKTTLLRILAGLQKPSSGQVSLGGESMERIDRRSIARRISVVPQARPPAFSFNALQFVLMGLHATTSRFSLDGRPEIDRARDALAQMAVSDLESRPMTQLSGGEAQRVVMARTMVSDAPIWLLDEPTSNLDLAHQVALLDAVRRHCDDGCSALAIVHDPNLVPRWFDRVLVLSGGAIVADGAPQKVLDATVFERAFGLSMRFVGDETHGAWVPELDPLPTRTVEANEPIGDVK